MDFQAGRAALCDRPALQAVLKRRPAKRRGRQGLSRRGTAGSGRAGLGIRRRRSVRDGGVWRRGTQQKDAAVMLSLLDGIGRALDKDIRKADGNLYSVRLDGNALRFEDIRSNPVSPRNALRIHIRSLSIA